MANHSKVLVVFENPATLKELLAAAGGLEFLPLRDRRQASAFAKAYPNLTAVIVEQTAASKAFLEVLQNLQAAAPKLRRIALSDSSDLFCVIDGVHTGAINAVVYRPIDARQLHAAITGTATAAAPVPGQQRANRRVAS
ncbi:MAG: hypothetical protein H7Z14_17040 [Anaerolineae bacterium]|nr:hypothetical protein [Phycisphaerae bacterium]